MRGRARSITASENNRPVHLGNALPEKSCQQLAELETRLANDDAEQAMNSSPFRYLFLRVRLDQNPLARPTSTTLMAKPRAKGDAGDAGGHQSQMRPQA